MDLTKRCDCCDKSIVKSQFARHERTQTHIQNLNNNNRPVEPVEPAESVNNDYDADDENDDDNDFLGNLNNTTIFVDNKNQKKEKKVKEVKVKDVKINVDVDDNDKSPTYGKENIMLLNKIKQFKLLFPEQLKGYKIKSGLSIQQLNGVLEEIEILVNSGTADKMMSDIFLSTISQIEPFSAPTKFDITGLSQCLNENEKFHHLMKILTVKYGSYIALPPEYQLVMVISFTTFAVIQSNKYNKSNNHLNQTI